MGVLMKIIVIICSVYLLAISLKVNAGVIDFETDATGNSPTDNGIIALTDIFMADDVAVQFGFDTNGDGILDTNAVYEQAGNVDLGNDTGFWGVNQARDIADANYVSLLGDFFLRQNDPYQPFGVFTILYQASNPVTAASGEIWDIDGGNNTEQFLVEAYNGATLLDSILSPLGVDKTLNAKPWAFGFSDLSNITQINITFTGSKTRGIGLAFNNFSPVEDISHSVNINEPSIPAIYALGVIGFLCISIGRLLNHRKYKVLTVQ